ncbi:hypothetical protein [Aquabacterium sp. J223]|uniref:hypothetical protein n=1 Tax=Aquabacterium sp. J223 TaxID=2898431 RepID=UPI0021AE2597|nr:hypothetical protein [Aquabacterium sp. J223]UUX95508.1 hypothetical protein LRS07_20255 [Aquabacterium sp. J223]
MRDVARGTALLALQPGPAGLAPPAALVVAAVLHELGELLPAHRLGVDLRARQLHRMGPLLGLGHETTGLARGADHRPLRGQQQRFARGQSARRLAQRRLQLGGQVQPLRQFRQAFGDAVLQPQRLPVEVQRVVRGLGRQRVEQLQRGVERGGQVAAQRRRRGRCGLEFQCPAGGPAALPGVPARVRLRLDRGQRRGAGLGRRSAATLHVARDPALLPPGGMADQPQRRVGGLDQGGIGPLHVRQRRLEGRQPAQQPVAAVHQRQRQQPAVRAPDAQRIGQTVHVDGEGDDLTGRQPMKRSEEAIQAAVVDPA